MGSIKSAYFCHENENLTSNGSELSPVEMQKVYLRIKPYQKSSESQFEIKENEIAVTQMQHDHSSGRENTFMHKYKFTRIFGPSSVQKEVFRGVCMEPLKGFLSGDDYLLFAYGATNAGKTYTIQGKPDGPGLIPQALNMVFCTLKGRLYSDCRFRPCKLSSVEEIDGAAQKMQRILKDQILSFPVEPAARGVQFCSTPNYKRLQEPKEFSSPSFQEMKSSLDEVVTSLETDRGGIGYYVWVSFFEIHNEQIYDLLDAPPTTRDGKRRTLSLVSTDRGSFVKDLRHVCAMSADEAYQVYMYGKHNLQVAATTCNAVSSRSHSVFSIRLIFHASDGELLVPRVCTFSCVDLAGTERSKKTLNAGDRLRETQHINSSLLVLGRCLEAIRHNQKSRDKLIVPYRDSKLTRVFQHSLMALQSVAIIINVNLDPTMTKETINTLKFSAVAREIVVVPMRNELHLPSTSRLCYEIGSGGHPTRGFGELKLQRETPKAQPEWTQDMQEAHLHQIHEFYQKKIRDMETEHRRKCEMLFKNDDSKSIVCAKLEHELAAVKRKLEDNGYVRENAQLKLRLAILSKKLKQSAARDDVANLELQLAIVNKKLKATEDILYTSCEMRGKEKLLTLVEVLQTQLEEALTDVETKKAKIKRLTELLVEVARNDCILLENDIFDFETITLNNDEEITCDTGNESVEILD